MFNVILRLPDVKRKTTGSLSHARLVSLIVLLQTSFWLPNCRIRPTGVPLIALLRYIFPLNSRRRFLYGMILRDLMMTTSTASKVKSTCITFNRALDVGVQTKDMFLAGKSTTQIAEWLDTTDHAPVPAYWYPQTVKSVLAKWRRLISSQADKGAICGLRFTCCASPAGGRACSDGQSAPRLGPV